MKRVAHIMETARGAFLLTFRRGPRTGRGRWRWRVSVCQLSGTPLSEAEADAVTVDVVADLVSRGVDVVRWGAGE
jgi:hypothetical protein